MYYVKSLLKTADRGSDVQIDEIKYEKIKGIENLVALVVASTCITGTAGPDIHAAYILKNGKLTELAIEDHKGKFKGVNYLNKLEGNRNYRFVVSDGKLQEKWHNKWGTANVVFTFDWRGNGFSVIDAEFKKVSQEKVDK